MKNFTNAPEGPYIQTMGMSSGKWFIATDLRFGKVVH